jgi:hypothetical protein
MPLVIMFSMLRFNLSFEPFSSLYSSLFELITLLVTHSSHVILFPLLVVFILMTNDSHFMTITNTFDELLLKLVATMHNTYETVMILMYRGRPTSQDC